MSALIGVLALSAIRNCYPASITAEIVGIELVFVGFAVLAFVAVVLTLKPTPKGNQAALTVSHRRCAVAAGAAARALHRSFVGTAMLAVLPIKRR